MPFLLKTEPSVYSFADLKKDKQTVWDGVTNPGAVMRLREMKPGEKLVIYHTGDERTAVGTAKVLSVDASNPKVPGRQNPGRQGGQESQDACPDERGEAVRRIGPAAPGKTFRGPTFRGAIRLDRGLTSSRRMRNRALCCATIETGL